MPVDMVEGLNALKPVYGSRSHAVRVFVANGLKSENDKEVSCHA
ncbi:hypothetical protein [Methanolobus sp. ZRKC5]